MSVLHHFDETDSHGRRRAEGLLRLRAKLASELPARSIEDTLLLATWNIREFDSAKYGMRTIESIACIAEILSHFDLIAVREVNADLKALDQNKHYDQMAFLSASYDPELVKGRLTSCKAGVFNFFDVVYRDEDEAVYAPEMGDGYARAADARARTRIYRQWRTFHMSDHLPMWMELAIDFGNEHLARVAAG